MTSLDLKLSRAQAIAIVSTLRNNECGIKSMIDTMKQRDNLLRAKNAAWILSLLPKEDKEMYLLPHYEELVDIATSSEPYIRRGLALSILTTLSTNEPNIRLLDFCFEHIQDTKESDSARAAMINIAARMCKSYPDLRNELTLYLHRMSIDSSQSIVAARRNALKMVH